MQQILQQELGVIEEAAKEMQKLSETRAQHTVQLNENQIVSEELALLEDDGVVYKLIGPALIKQDLAEAKLNVQKRIQFIQGQIDGLDQQIKKHQEKQEEAQKKIVALQELLKRSAAPQKK